LSATLRGYGSLRVRYGVAFEWMVRRAWKRGHIHHDLATFTCGAGVCPPPKSWECRSRLDTAKVGVDDHFEP
jgi:hypothetical protein